MDHCRNGSKMRSHENLRDSMLLLIRWFLKIIFLAFQRINLKHNLDQLIPQSKVLQSEISDEDSGSHSMDSNPAQGEIFFMKFFCIF